MIVRKTFFDRVRTAPFPGRLTDQQVKGMEAILSEWEKRPYTDLRWLAYMLATAYHETAHTMQPVTEYGARSYFNRYEGRSDLGNTVAGDGYRFRGRGYVQLTGRRNYNLASEKLGVDLVGNPDLALDPQIAASIMFVGMVEGWFTGKKLSNYFNIKTDGDWVNARRIINGLDRASTIAGYGRMFYTALSDAWDGTARIEPTPPVMRQPDDPGPDKGIAQTATPAPSLWQRFIRWLFGL